MNHARVVHRLARRVRLVAPALAKQPERCYLLEILLRKHAGVKDVRVVPSIGSLTLYFDPTLLPEARLLAPSPRVCISSRTTRPAPRSAS